MTITAAEVCLALRLDRSPDSGQCREYPSRELSEPREIWLSEAKLWIREDGRYVTGWRNGVYETQRFHLLGPMRIRQSVRAWHAARTAG